MTKTIFDRIKEVADKDQKTVEQTALKLVEECGEVAEAVLSFTGAPACSYKNKSLEDIVEECCDVIIVAYTLAGSKYRIPKSIIEDRIGRKLLKWEEKINAEATTQLGSNEHLVEVSAEQAFSLADSTELLVFDTGHTYKSSIMESYNKQMKIIRVHNSNEYYTVDRVNNRPDLRFWVTKPVARVLEIFE